MALVVNGEFVDDSLIRAEAQSLRPQFQDAIQGMDPVDMEIQLREWSRENVIERILLRQEAMNDPETVPGEIIDKALDELREQNCQVTPANEEALRIDIEARLRVTRLIEKIGGKVVPPKHKQIAEYYRKHKEEFQTPEVVRAGHIVKNVNGAMDEAAALEAIRKVEEELKEGANFEELADRSSDCAGNGGDLGYFPRGQMVDEFDDVVFTLPIGQPSPIFRTAFGFHIAKAYDRKPAGFRSFDDVREDIGKELHRQKQQKALEDFLDRIKARASIEDSAKQAAK